MIIYTPDTVPTYHGGTLVRKADFEALSERIAYLELENANLLRAATDAGLLHRTARLESMLEGFRD